MKKLAERIKALRTERGLTQKQLGKELGLRDTTIGHWENGFRLPSLETLVKIADFFGVTTDYLLGRTDY